MSCGVPVVAFDCKCGPRDIIADGDNGLLVAESDVQGLAAGIIRLIEDKALRKRLGKSARKEIELNFTEPVIMQRWVKLFETLN